jgi:hypothetical protein
VSEQPYEPFGAEWEAEMMKHTKQQLVDMLRRRATPGTAPSFEELYKRVSKKHPTVLPEDIYHAFKEEVYGPDSH